MNPCFVVLCFSLVQTDSSIHPKNYVSGSRFVVFCFRLVPWWRHQMETFSALLAICAGNSPVTGEFPTQRPVMRSFDVFFDLRLNKLLNKNHEAGDLTRHRAHYDVFVMTGESFKNAYELVILRAHKFWTWYNKIFCAEFRRYPLKFHARYLIHTRKDAWFVEKWRFESSWVHELVRILKRHEVYFTHSHRTYFTEIRTIIRFSQRQLNNPEECG